MHYIQHPQQAIPYTLLRSKRKTLALQINAEHGVRVRAPLHLSQDKIEAFIQERLDWIWKHYQAHCLAERKAKPQWEEGAKHYILGDEFVLRYYPHERENQISVRVQGKELQVLLPAQADRSLVPAWIEGWYKQLSKTVLAQEAAQCWAHFVAATGYQGSVPTFHWRKMKARWGTCYPQRAKIFLNLELLRSPLDALRYIIYHECCHLIEANHSQRFYAWQTKVCPDWKRYRQMLKAY